MTRFDDRLHTESEREGELQHTDKVKIKHQIPLGGLKCEVETLSDLTPPDSRG